MKVTQVLMLLLIFVSATFAQNGAEKPVSKFRVAIIDTALFEDERRGIEKLVKAVKRFETETYGPYHRADSSFLSEISKLEKEICSGKDDEEASVKRNRIELLKNEVERVEAERGAFVKKKLSVVIEPVLNAIQEQLKVFAKANGYNLLFDKSKIEVGALFVNPDIEDVTAQFIQFCNDNFDKEKSK